MKELAAATSEGWANPVCSPRLCDEGHSLIYYVSCPKKAEGGFLGVGESVQKNLSLILLRKGECICAM